MKNPVTVKQRHRLVFMDFFDLEPTENKAWLSRTQCGTIYTVKGVPSSELDLLIVEKTEDTKIPSDYVRVLDLGYKEGKYGGKRCRITVRYMPFHQAPASCVEFKVEVEESKATVHVGSAEYCFGRYKSYLDVNSDLTRIVRWHYSRYYKMLSEEDVDGVETEFCSTVLNGKYTLAEANRLASRLLYRAARNCGYRKLTIREQKRLGLNGQWHTEAEYAEAQHTRFHASSTGCGEYTIEVARRPRTVVN